MEIQNIVAELSIKRIPKSEILQEIHTKTGKTISRVMLFYIKQRIKKDSYKWYQKLNQGEYEYLHELRQRIMEINDLQRRHYEICDSKAPTPIKQSSLAALHNLNITLSNYYDIIPFLRANSNPNPNSNFNRNSGNNQTQIPMQGFEIEENDIFTRWEKDDRCKCRADGGHIFKNNKCASCYTEWCPKATGEDYCLNPHCSHGIAGLKFKPWVANRNDKWIQCSCKIWFKTQEILETHLSAYPHANAREPPNT